MTARTEPPWGGDRGGGGEREKWRLGGELVRSRRDNRCVLSSAELSVHNTHDDL